jgi:transcriptional regulator with XRE-family HTH domain
VRTTRSWLIGLEKGRRSPGPDLLVRLAEALGVDPLSLLATDGEPTLAQYRFAAGLTQQEIADRVGCSDVSYSSLERGVTTTLQIGEAVILAEIFGVDAEEVMSALGRHQRG